MLSKPDRIHVQETVSKWMQHRTFKDYLKICLNIKTDRMMKRNHQFEEVAYESEDPSYHKETAGYLP